MTYHESNPNPQSVTLDPTDGSKKIITPADANPKITITADVSTQPAKETRQTPSQVVYAHYLKEWNTAWLNYGVRKRNALIGQHIGSKAYRVALAKIGAEYQTTMRDLIEKYTGVEGFNEAFEARVLDAALCHRDALGYRDVGPVQHAPDQRDALGRYYITGIHIFLMIYLMILLIINITLQFSAAQRTHKILDTTIEMLAQKYQRIGEAK
ncbi:hypothetical protein F4803DRAFT_576738 [Xylaria telfairii]|nr:hypothetical protein F4803DRAFT_576738 [Xylaria telfairii]